MLDERYHYWRPGTSALAAAARELLELAVFVCLLDSHSPDSLILEQLSVDLALFVTGEPLRNTPIWKAYAVSAAQCPVLFAATSDFSGSSVTKR